jgi:hypothetical protein
MSQPSQPLKPRPWGRVTLAQLQRIKQWREARHASHPQERRMWETVLTLWLMGWVGWLPAFEAEAYWAFPLCMLGIFSPALYVHWRRKAHAARRLRCDWLHLLD